jgi:hypothetical protein
MTAPHSPSPPSMEYQNFAPSQEVRFAVVMYGSVSLAIYINGVAQELLKLVRATAPAEPISRAPTTTLLVSHQLTGSERVYRKLGQWLGSASHGPRSTTKPTLCGHVL